MRWLQFLTPVKSIDFNETKAMIDQAGPGDMTLLDVRQPGEYKQAHIPGATLIPLPQLGDRIGEVPKDRPVLVYCAVGGRSRAAAQMLAGKGFDQVFNVTGGIKAWQDRTAVGPEDQGMHLFTGEEGAEQTLSIAYSLEEGLCDFYESLAPKAENPEVASLFHKLAAIEVKHQASIVLAFRALGHPDATEETLAALAGAGALEGGMTTEEYLDRFKPDLGSSVDIVSMAMSIEAQALDLYQRTSNRMSDPGASRVLMTIAEEEKEHLSSLGRLMDSLGES